MIQNKAQCLAANECGVYNDVKINVPVDGDGILEYVTSETKNEFDVVLSNGSRLIFISCKDTEITNDHLYEITELARHYGGKYAKVAVVSTVPEATVIKNRAKLSEISIISDVSDMTYDAFKNKIAELGMR